MRAPRVNHRRTDPVTGERTRFASAIRPAWARKSPQVAEVLPLFHLHGLSSNDFGPALEQFLGSAAGLPAATTTRLTTQWQQEATGFNHRSLADADYVYVWVDGIHLTVRLAQGKVCLLVTIGGWPPRCSRSGMGRWGSGVRCMRCSQAGNKDSRSAILVRHDPPRAARPGAPRVSTPGVGHAWGRASWVVNWCR